MDKKENTPFIIDFKNNYGSSGNNNNVAGENSSTSSMIYCLRGKQSHIELRGHCHRQRSEGVDEKARKKLIIASCLCVFFMVAEIIGGVLSNSLAIATDAAHLLTDFASFMISLFAIGLAGRPSTKRMTFGWYRAEVLGATVSVLMIWVITAILVWLAIGRVISGEHQVDAKIMLITSFLAIVVNAIMGFQLTHSHSHGDTGHSHGQSIVTPTTTPTQPKKLQTTPGQPATGSSPALTQTNTKPVSYQNSTSREDKAPSVRKSFVSIPKEDPNMNVRAAYIHVLGDVLQSIGVFLAALLIYFKPEWSIADPICTFIFSVIVMFTTFTILKDALLVLMEGTPNNMDYAEVMEIFMNTEGVERVHNLRIWALSINKVALSAHLAVAPNANAKKILQEATTAVHCRYRFFETTIQIEDFTPDMESCQQCTTPAS